MSQPPNDLAITRDSLLGGGDEAAYAGVTSFMRRRYTRDLANADVAVLGVPFDLATTHRSGSRLGPRAIRSISSTLAWEKAVNGWGFSPFDRLAVVDYGAAPSITADPRRYRRKYTTMRKLSLIRMLRC
ncbi:MAG: arginase family protein [Caldilineaceae bacterium]|nr:arginase family protein [Caldilineaceae bacterium]